MGRSSNEASETSPGDAMARVLAALDRDLGRIQTGARGVAAHLMDIPVEHAGARRPLSQIAAISVPDPHQIVVQPWNPADVRLVGAAIAGSRVGLTASVDGPRLRITVPSLTEARRLELSGLVRRRAEEARVEVRRVRHAALATIRSATGPESDGSRRDRADLDRLTARFVADIDSRAEAKVTSLLDIG